jgi:methylenetetrahydrofolate dehydrogenase (NADP+)/methenyltetrahydrofolate cyclohydrolase
MMVIDGKTIALTVREDAKKRTETLRTQGIVPCLAVILAGEDPASVSYVTGKEKALAEAGMASRDIHVRADISEAELLSLIASLNEDTAVHGILVQLPLPKHVREDRVIDAVSPQKDVDGFHPVSVGNMVLGKDGFLPCTPNGIVWLLRTLDIPVNGAHAVIVGRSNLVGRPLSILLTRRDINATVTVCHTGTRDVAYHTRQADILIAAAGRAGLITGNMVK